MVITSDKRRDTKGRYICDTTDNYNENSASLKINLPDKLLYKLIILILLMLVLSPWIFLMTKNYSHSQISDIVSNFYYENFSCKPPQIRNSTNQGPAQPNSNF